MPPFLEQVTRAVLEAEDGNAFEGKPCEQALVRPDRRVPATLQASLIERLDRLGRRSGLLAEINGSASAHSLDPFKDQRCRHLRIILTRNNPSFAEPHVDPIQHPEQGHGNGHQERTLRLIEIWLYLPQYS